MITSLNLENLSAMPLIFSRMRRGSHIHSGDGALYFALSAHQEEYSAAFAMIGYTLISNPANFFYLDGEDSDQLKSKRGGEVCALSFVLIDQASSAGFGFDEWFFPESGESRQIPDLDVFRTHNHRDMLSKVDISSPQDLERVLKFMARLGMVRFEQGAVTFLPPFRRIHALCLELASLGQDGIDRLAETTATGSTTNEAEGDE